MVHFFKIHGSDYTLLLNDPDKPLLNRVLRGSYTPGSTMKPFMALGGLELGLRKPEDTVLSVGEFHIPGQSRGYRDDKRGGHGRVDMVQAIAQSVNTYFYSLAYDMGIDRLSTFMAKLGTLTSASTSPLRGSTATAAPARPSNAASAASCRCASIVR